MDRPADVLQGDFQGEAASSGVARVNGTKLEPSPVLTAPCLSVRPPPQDYEGQKAGGYDDDKPVANRAGRTDVEGCCWWGRDGESSCSLRAFNAWPRCAVRGNN